MTPNGNTILVTGGASGIGLALAAALQAQGNRVIIAGRRQSALDAALAAHPGLIARALDVADPASVAQVARGLIEDHPDLNVLINNAGIMQAETLSDADPSIAEATVVTNLLGPIRLTAALLPHLLTRPKASIINVTSGLAFVPLARTPTYSATKAALHSWTQSLRHQMRDTAIEVLELAPPAVQTDLMPGQATSPHAMPLAGFTAEVMALLAVQPASEEILVQRVQGLRRAEAERRFAEVFQMLNPAGAAP